MKDPIKITIPLVPVTKKNHQRIAKNRKTGQLFILPSGNFEQYKRDCRPFLGRYRGNGCINHAVNVRCEFYMPTRRRCDLVNLLEAVDDLLTDYGIIEDDNSQIVAGHDGSRVRYDKNNPRTEIEITEMEADA